jgi:hypothetical protein
VTPADALARQAQVGAELAPRGALASRVPHELSLERVERLSNGDESPQRPPRRELVQWNQTHARIVHRRRRENKMSIPADSRAGAPPQLRLRSV